MYVIHEEKAEFATWFKLIFIIPAGLLIGALAAAYFREMGAFFTLFGDAVLITALFYFIFPRKFQIYSDKLRIVLGSPIAINIPLSTIQEIRPSSGSSAFSYSGVRFATSTRNIIEIKRNRGMNYVISPQNSGTFMEQLNQAIRNTGLN
jgi:hypothetical protein